MYNNTAMNVDRTSLSEFSVESQEALTRRKMSNLTWDYKLLNSTSNNATLNNDIDEKSDECDGDEQSIRINFDRGSRYLGHHEFFPLLQLNIQSKARNNDADTDGTQRNNKKLNPSQFLKSNFSFL